MNQLSTLVKIIPQLLSDGLALGFVYAIVAIGYTMVYGIREFINFAHSELFMFGAFVGTEILLLLKSLGILANMSPTLALIIALLVAMIMSGSLGVAVDRIAYHPVRSAPKLVPFISAIGVSFILQDVVRMVEDAKNGNYYLYAPTLFTKRIQIADNMVIPEKTLFIVGLCLLMMAALTLFVNKTKWGKAMRAVAQDRDTAKLMGIKLLLMDEPSMGLAPMLVELIFQSIKQLNWEGITILLVEQNAKKALKVSNRGYVLQTGVITLSGTGEELLKNDTVREAYLG